MLLFVPWRAQARGAQQGSFSNDLKLFAHAIGLCMLRTELLSVATGEISQVWVVTTHSLSVVSDLV